MAAARGRQLDAILGEPTPAETRWPQGKREELTGIRLATDSVFGSAVDGRVSGLSLLSIPIAVSGKKVFTKFEYLIFAVCLWVLVFSAFTEYGDNHRFSIPCLPIMMYVVVTWGWKCVTAMSTKPSLKREVPPRGARAIRASAFLFFPGRDSHQRVHQACSRPASIEPNASGGPPVDSTTASRMAAEEATVSSRDRWIGSVRFRPKVPSPPDRVLGRRQPLPECVESFSFQRGNGQSHMSGYSMTRRRE